MDGDVDVDEHEEKVLAALKATDRLRAREGGMEEDLNSEEEQTGRKAATTTKTVRIPDAGDIWGTR